MSFFDSDKGELQADSCKYCGCEKFKEKNGKTKDDQITKSFDVALAHLG